MLVVCLLVLVLKALLLNFVRNLFEAPWLLMIPVLLGAPLNLRTLSLGGGSTCPGMNFTLFISGISLSMSSSSLDSCFGSSMLILRSLLPILFLSAFLGILNCTLGYSS